MNRIFLFLTLAIAVQTTVFGQFEEQKFVLAGSVTINNDIGSFSPSAAMVLKPNQLLGLRTSFFVDGEVDFLSVTAWFRHHYNIEAAFPLYLYLEPEVGYVDNFADGSGFLGLRTGFAIPLGSRFMITLQAANAQVVLGDDSRFLLGANLLSGEFLVRF